MITLYELLDVEPDADEQGIRRAYRELAKTHHPDVSDAPDARTRFQRLTTAKEVLTDPAERARYDRLGHDAYVAQHLDGDIWSRRGESAGSAARTYSDGGTAGAETISQAAERMADETASTTTATRATQQVDRDDGYATASDYYRPGQRIGVQSRSSIGRTLAAARDVLPWLLAHFLLLVGAVAVALALLAGSSAGGVPTVTSIFVAATLVAITAGVSMLHITSTVFR